MSFVRPPPAKKFYIVLILENILVFILLQLWFKFLEYFSNKGIVICGTFQRSKYGSQNSNIAEKDIYSLPLKKFKKIQLIQLITQCKYFFLQKCMNLEEMFAAWSDLKSFNNFSTRSINFFNGRNIYTNKIVVKSALCSVKIQMFS
jgi:hypothetical protein